MANLGLLGLLGLLLTWTLALPDAHAQNAPALSPTPPYPKHAPPVHANSKYAPAPGFEKFAIIDTPKFYQTDTFTVADPRAGAVRNIQYNYAYQDGRYFKTNRANGPSTDLVIEIYEFATPAAALAHFRKKLAGAQPEAVASKVKLPPCHGEKRNSDNFVGPLKLVKKMRHPSGSEVVVWRSGDFNRVDCTRGNNRDEFVSWTDGVCYFEVCALPPGPFSPNTNAYGMAEEFAVDYLAALGQPVTVAMTQ